MILKYKNVQRGNGASARKGEQKQAEELLAENGCYVSRKEISEKA